MREGMSDTSLPLFDDSTVFSTPPDAKACPPGKPRVQEPERSQGEIRFEVPDDMVPASHPARVLWEILGTVKLSAFSVDCEWV